MNKNYSCQGRFLPYRQVNVMFGNAALRVKNILMLVFLLTMASFWNAAYADGSKDLYPSGVVGNRAFLYSNSYTAGGTTINSWPFKTLGTHYVYAQVGETIATGSSAQNIGNGRIRLIAPDGTQFLSAANTTGQIPNRAGELAGPQYPGQGAGGNRYVPYSVVVAAGQAGIWKVEFLPSGSETSSSTPSVTDVAADANWTQGNNTELIAAWDISVRNAANSNWISGRVYSNVFNLHIQGTSFLETKAFYGKFTVLTRDGIAYRVTNNGSNGVGFTFFVNNKGFLDATGNPSYKSLNLSSPSSADFRVHDPRSQDDANNVTHKIFYTTPAADLPSSATQAVSTSLSVTTWLKNSVITPTATNITYTGAEGTPNRSGNKGAYIGFDSNLSGTYRIEILGAFPTRTITGNCNMGTNTVFWDGRDGAGNTLPANTNIGEIRVQLFGAEVHFPFIDMEINPGGIIIEQLNSSYNLYTPNRDLVYWDDSNVQGGNANTQSNPTASGIAGISSNSNGHKWGRYTTGSSGSGNNGDGGSSFGNEKSLDTWSFVPGEVIIKTLDIIVAAADLEVVSVTPSTTSVAVGQQVNYNVVVKNNGPSDVTGSGFAFVVPAGFTITGVTYVNSQGTVVVVSGAVDPVSGNYIADLNMTNGSEIVFTITGTVGSSLAGQPLNVEASIIRPADVTDIDATHPGTTPPTDPHLECRNGTAVENCNNIKYNNLNVAAIADLTIVKTANVTVPTIGQSVTFTIAVTNNGPNAATGVVVTDQLPTGFTYVSSTVTAGTYNSGTGIWTIGNIANGVTRTMTVTATVNVTGNYTNVATVTGTENDPVPGDNTDDVTVAPDADANLEIVKTVNNATPNVGSQVEFTLVVTNNGPGNATNVLVTDQLPSGYTYVSHTAGQSYASATGLWTVGNLANGAIQTLVITATVNATGNHTNTATVDGDENDPDTTDNTDSTTTTPVNVIVANNDATVTPVNGITGGPAIANVVSNDTLNGAAITAGSVTVSVAPGAVPAGLSFNTSTGAVSVNAGTPAGTYTFDYTICEVLNPTNCDTAQVTVNVAAAPIVANNDTTATPVNGMAGGTAIPNVLTNDTLNGAAITAGSVTVSVAPGAVPAGLSFNTSTGAVSVNAGTPAGTYTFDYTICEVLNPTNCDTAQVTVNVAAAPIVANNDNPTPVNGYEGDTDVVNVLTNDTLNGVPVVPSEVVITVTTPSTNPGVELDPATGTVSVDPETPAGTYTIVYQLCEILNPTNCDSATVTIVVTAPPIVAVNDTNATPVNGYVGGNAIPNVLANDTLNGVAVIPGEVTVSVVPGSVPAGITFNTTTGAVDVLAETPAGNYTFDYTICEILNPTNCDTATVTVVVAAAPIVANNDTPTPVNGYEGNPDVVNVLDNDTLNGVPVVPSEVVITVTTPSTNPGVELDPATGTVSIDPQTPAGTYTIVYQLCEILNPTNCDSATVTVVVEEAPIDAVNDNPAPVNGYEGNTDVVNVLDNDTLNGVPVIPSQVTITVTTPSANPGAELDPATGTVSVDPQTPAGTYTIVYQLCEILNPTNCDSATVTIVVEEAPIDAVNDNPVPVNGYEGNTDVVNVLDNDTLNGVPVIPSQVTITVTTPSANPGVELDPATGTVSVDPQTPAGSYTIVYQLCEILNPTNCDSATVTVVVEEAPIDAVNDNPTPVNGYEGNTDVVNVLDNDTLNGVPVIPSQVTITVTTPSTNPGVELDPATGTVSVDPQTPAGSYTIVYQLCEILNPTNCDSATVTVVVEEAPIDAVNDNPAPVNGYEGNTDVVNVLDNDTLNGVPVIPSQVTITVTTPSANPGVELDPATGTVSVDPQTPAGTYTIVYQLCEILNPTNCDSATVTVVVEEAPIDAVNDNPTPVNGYEGNTDVVNVLDNDTLNGVPVIPSQVTIMVTTPSTNPGVELDPATGTVSVDPQTPAGTYTIVYQLCEILNPTNCDSATVTVVVEEAPIDAVNDNPTPVNGYEGNTDVVNVLDNDTLNGVPVIPSQVTITVTTPSANPGVELDPATGTVSVDPQTPAGTYTIVYQLCEILNPTNCDSATVTIVVEEAPIDAVDDTPAPINGYEGNPDVVNVLDNDTLNGVPIIPSQVTITVTTPSTNPGVELDPATGTVSVDPQTPAGTYTIVYQLCEILNPTNCESATVTIVVNPAPIDAVNDDLTGTIVNGTEGMVNAGNVFTNDTLNGVAVIPSEVTLTTVNADAPLTLNPDGTITVAPGTPAGTYTLEYSICEILNPTNCDTAIVTILVQVPGVEIIKQGTFNDANGDGFAQVGETITYNFTVINTGTMELTNITVSDPLVAVTGGPLATLAAGATDSTTFTAVYTFTQADIDAGVVNNQALVTATPVVGTPITDDSDSNDPTLPGNDDPTVTVLPQNPKFELFKEGVYQDANNDGIVNAGDVIQYSFTVRNTGNVTITNISVTDPIVAVSGGPIASLAPQATDSTTFTATYTISQADIELGAVYNLALAEGTDPSGNPIDVESQDPSPLDPNDPLYEPTCPDCTVTIIEQNPAIALIKTATFNDSNNNGIAEVGETITYNFTVTNTGNVSLSDVTVTDPLPGVVVSGGPITLAVGESDSTTFTAIYTITQADINAGSVSNQAFVTGNSPLDVEVTDASDHTDNAGNNPTIVEIDGCTINVFNVVTPNNDGSNEFLYIGGLGCYPDNKVEIFNRWGVVVYETSGYNNNDKAFRGYSEGRVTVNKSEGLPDGTYFYILKYKKQDGTVREKSGYLYLSR